MVSGAGDAGRGELGRHRQQLWVLYVMEGLTSVGANLMQTGIFFYTHHQLGWSLGQNFLLAAGQGVVFVVGALSASWLTGVFGRRRTLAWLWLGMALVALAAALSGPWLVAVLLLMHTLMNAANWPALESLVSSGVDAHRLSRRLAVYNFIWSGAGALTIASVGTIIAVAPGAFFPLAMGVHGVSLGLLLWHYRGVGQEQQEEGAHAAPEPELLRARTLALWLSRIALPSTYMVTTALMAMMPELPVIQALEPQWQTVVGSVWLGARWVAFVVLGLAVWWHTRPHALLAAAGLMLVAFVGVTVRPSALLALDAAGLDLVSMVLWQVALGATLGMIYTGSLYFGMVLSAGSTEHGGYHEALIGVGVVLGPLAGYMGQLTRPGDVYAGVVAVSAVIGLTVGLAGLASVVARRRAS